MKQEALKVFQMPENSPVKIHNGLMIQAQVYDHVDESSGGSCVLVDFRLSPALLPDESEIGALSHDIDADTEIDADIDPEMGIDSEAALDYSIPDSIPPLYPVGQLVLNDWSEVEGAIEKLDKIMLYLFAVRGVDDVKLLRDRESLFFAPVKANTLDMETTFQYAETVFVAGEYLASPECSSQMFSQSVAIFSAVVGLGATEISDDKRLVTFLDLVDPEQYDEDGFVDADVTMRLNPDETIMLEYSDADGREYSVGAKATPDNMLAMLYDLWELGRARGLSNEVEYNTFSNVYHIMNDGRALDDILLEIVPVMREDNHYQQAMKRFVEMDAPVLALH